MKKYLPTTPNLQPFSYGAVRPSLGGPDDVGRYLTEKYEWHP